MTKAEEDRAAFAASIQKEADKDKRQRAEAGRKAREMRQLLEADVLPHMPRSLASYYRVSSVWPGYEYPLRSFAINCMLRDPSLESRAHRIAFGTIDKVVKGLRKGGWSILQEPEATAGAESSAMTIELRAGHPLGTKRTVRLSMTFGGIKETDKCRLVEKEVIVAAAYTPEHIEKRMVVECNDSGGDAAH